MAEGQGSFDPDRDSVAEDEKGIRSEPGIVFADFALRVEQHDRVGRPFDPIAGVTANVDRRDRGVATDELADERLFGGGLELGDQQRVTPFVVVVCKTMV